MKRFLILLALGFSCFLRPLPLIGQALTLNAVKNTPLLLPADALTTNGIPGLTNTAALLMVSAASTNSAFGGSVVLVNTQAWVNLYDSPAHNDDYGVALAPDRLGNLIVVGSSYGLDNAFNLLAFKFGPDGAALWTNIYSGPGSDSDFGVGVGTDASNNIYVAGSSVDPVTGNDVVVLKYSSAGAVVWTNRYNSATNNYDFPTAFGVDAAGDSYVLVTTYSSAATALVTLKYDSLGNADWTNIYQGPAGGPDYPEALAVDRAGDVIVTGSSAGSGGFGEDIATIKYAPAGTALWTNRYDNDIIDQPAAITTDLSGNVIVSGVTYGNAPLSYVTIKYGADGTPLWTNYVTGPNYTGGGVPRVAADPQGNVFVLGASPTASAVGNVDLMTWKLSGAGLPLWTNRFQDSNTDSAAPAGVAVDNAGNSYLSCHSTGPSGTNIDYVTIKYSSGGAPVWTNRYDGSAHGADEPQAIATDTRGNVYVTGQTTTSAGDLDFATVKYADDVLYTPPTDYVGLDSFTITVVDSFGNSTNATVDVAVSPSSLEFNSLPADFGPSAQGMRLRVDGARGTNPVVLYASSNLLDWMAVATNTPLSGTATFLDSAALDLPHRFYRAVQSQ